MSTVFHRLVRFLVLISIFSILVVHPDLPFPHITTSKLFFQFFLGLALVAGGICIFFDKHFEIPRSALFKIIVLYSLVSIFSTIFAFNPSESFYGSLERLTGLLHTLQFPLFLLVILTFFREERSYLWLFIISLGVSLIAAGHFLVAFIAHDFSWPAYIFMGNRTFLAGNALLHVFLSLLLLRYATKKWHQIVLFILAAVFSVTIVASGVRAALLGLFIGGLFYACASAWSNHKTRRGILAALAGILIVYGLLFAFKQSIPALQNNYAVKKLTDISFADETLQSRLTMWKMGLRAVWDRPLLGWGRESFHYVFTRYFDPSFEDTGVTESWADHPHNIFLNELVENGFFGFAFFLALFFFAYKTAGGIPAARAAIAAAALYGFFSIETIFTALPFTLLLGYLIVRSANFSLAKQFRSFILASGIIAMLCGIFLIGNALFTYREFISFNRPVITIGEQRSKERIQAVMVQATDAIKRNSPYEADELLVLARHALKSRSAIAARILVPRLAAIFSADQYAIRSGVAAAMLSETIFLDSRERQAAEQGKALWRSLIEVVPKRRLFWEGLEEIERLERQLQMKKSK